MRRRRGRLGKKASARPAIRTGAFRRVTRSISRTVARPVSSRWIGFTATTNAHAVAGGTHAACEGRIRGSHAEHSGTPSALQRSWRTQMVHVLCRRACCCQSRAEERLSSAERLEAHAAPWSRAPFRRRRSRRRSTSPLWPSPLTAISRAPRSRSSGPCTSPGHGRYPSSSTWTRKGSSSTGRRAVGLRSNCWPTSSESP